MAVTVRAEATAQQGATRPSTVRMPEERPLHLRPTEGHEVREAPVPTEAQALEEQEERPTEALRTPQAQQAATAVEARAAMAEQAQGLAEAQEAQAPEQQEQHSVEEAQAGATLPEGAEAQAAS